MKKTIVMIALVALLAIGLASVVSAQVLKTWDPVLLNFGGMDVYVGVKWTQLSQDTYQWDYTFEAPKYPGDYQNFGELTSFVLERVESHYSDFNLAEEDQLSANYGWISSKGTNSATGITSLGWSGPSVTETNATFSYTTKLAHSATWTANFTGTGWQSPNWSVDQALMGASAAAPSAVPEPMSMVLGFTGLSSVLGFSRLRKRA